jgi:AhpD family alkylhydroperoxidase
MPHDVFPPATAAMSARRKALAPQTHDAFTAFSEQVFAEGALPEVTKQLIAVAVAHTTQCPYCIRGHTKLARRKGASDEQIMEAIWVAAEMRAGGAYAHAAIALDALDDGASHYAGSAQTPTTPSRWVTTATSPVRLPAEGCGHAHTTQVAAA